MTGTLEDARGGHRPHFVTTRHDRTSRHAASQLGEPAELDVQRAGDAAPAVPQ